MTPSFWAPTPGPSPRDELTPEQADRLRRFIRLRVIICGSYAAILTAILLVTLVVLARQHPDRHPNPWVLSGLVFGLPLLIAVTLLITIRRLLLRPTPVRLIVSGDAKDRRRVGRRLRKGLPLEECDRPIGQAQVDVLHRQRRLIWLLVPLGIAYVGLLLLDHNQQVAFHLVVGVAYLGLPAAVWWSSRRLERNAAAQGITPTLRP